MNEIEELLDEIMEYQMSHVELARTTVPYKLAEKALNKLRESKAELPISGVSNSLPHDVAEKILKVRDAYIENDIEDVWHHLYSIASPNFDKKEPWQELEKIAGRL